MSDIFVSYAREDRDVVAPLAADLERLGWSVWWDHLILAGKDFDEVIQAQIDNARCVLVVWTADTNASRWVRAEASEGLRRGILVPIAVTGAIIPLAFRNIQTVEFGDTPFLSSSPAFSDLVAALTSLLGPPRAQAAAAAAVPLITAVTPAHPPRVSVADASSPFASPASGRASPSKTAFLGAAIVAVILLAAYIWFRPRSPVIEDQAPAPAIKPISEPTGTTGRDTKPASAPAQSDAAMDDAALRMFVDDFIAATNSADVDWTLSFYADRVDYFAQGIVGRDDIRKEFEAYFRRWPEVNNRVDGRISIRDVGDPARKLLQFRTVYDVRSAARDARARGSVRLALIVGLVDGAARIVDQKEWTAASQAGP